MSIMGNNMRSYAVAVGEKKGFLISSVRIYQK